MNAKKILSHIYPATVKSGITRQGQAYEINFENGHKVLNSQNANYSYGSLHQIMQKGIFESLKQIQPKKILMLGLGGGSAVEILNKKCNWPIEITAVEFDEDLVKFAREDFNIERFNNLDIIVYDAFEWMLYNKGLKFDLIIDDLFIDDQVPPNCFDKEYLKGISEYLNEGGIYFRNMMNTSESGMQAYDAKIKDLYKKVGVCKAKGYENLIYICTK